MSTTPTAEDIEQANALREDNDEGLSLEEALERIYAERTAAAAWVANRSAS